MDDNCICMDSMGKSYVLCGISMNYRCILTYYNAITVKRFSQRIECFLMFDVQQRAFTEYIYHFKEFRNTLTA